MSNSERLKFKVSLCAFKLKSLPAFLREREFYGYELKAVTLTRALDNIVVDAQFTGTREVARNFIRKLVNGISPPAREGYR